MKKAVTQVSHALVPEHLKVTEKEKTELVKKHNITLDSLPRILKDDPAIATLDVKTGDMVKILRPSPTAGTAAYYRVVVDE